MKVFSKKKFLENRPNKMITKNSWVDYCDGKEVYENRIFEYNSKGEVYVYIISENWCEEI